MPGTYDPCMSGTGDPSRRDPLDARLGISPIEAAKHWETPANERWPPPDACRRMHDRPWMPVTVRVEWSTGVEHHEANAVRWEPGRPWVRVVFNDRRLQTRGLWLDSRDVERR